MLAGLVYPPASLPGGSFNSQALLSSVRGFPTPSDLILQRTLPGPCVFTSVPRPVLFPPGIAAPNYSHY